jgi:hypothetical protein
MDCHCSLFLIGTLDFLATFEGVCGGCSIPSLTLTLVRSAYHHQINGKMEVVNDSLGDLLQSLVVIISSLEIMNYFKRNSLTIGLWIKDLALFSNLKRVNTKAEDLIAQTQQVHKAVVHHFQWEFVGKFSPTRRWWCRPTTSKFLKKIG